MKLMLALMCRNACFAVHVAGLQDEVKVIKGCGKPIATEYHGHSGKLVHGFNGTVPLPCAADCRHNNPRYTIA